MTISTKIKKILLQIELLELDETQFEGLDRKYEVEFNNDFRKELLFLRKRKRKIESPHVVEKIHEEIYNNVNIEKSELKSLHRKLARETHPDLTQEDTEEEFKKIQNAYDKGDGATLLKEAVARKIDVEISDMTYETIKANLERRRNILIEKQRALHWVWGGSGKTRQDRKKMQEIMGIKRKEFSEWIKKRGK